MSCEGGAFTLASPSGVMETLGGEVSSTVMNTDATLDRPALLTVTVKMYTPAPTRHQKEKCETNLTSSANP
jgi:hypothetical protein